MSRGLGDTPSMADGRHTGRQAEEVPPVDFLIVGAMKCATTTLVRALAAHPGAFLPEREVHFFDDDAAYASVWRGGRISRSALRLVYGAHFDDAGEGSVVGTKAPSYMASALAMERVRLFHPDARVVVMLRDPVARAQSHWNHLLRMRARGVVEPDEVGDTFREHVERDAAELAARATPDAEVRRTNVLHRGDFAPQLERVWRLFPRERVLVGSLEELSTDPAGCLTRVCEFVGLTFDPVTVEAAEGETASRKAHSEDLTPDDRRFLADFYAEPLDRLRALLDAPLTGWGEA